MHTAPVIAAEAGAGGSLLLPSASDLLWGTVAFVVILAIFAWRVLPRLNTLLDQRGAAIEGRIDEAKHAREEAERVLSEYQAQLAESRAEAGRIREQAREDGRRIIAEMREQAQAEADRIAAQAQSQIQAEREKAIADLRAEVGTLALNLASGVIGEQMSDDARATSYVDRFLADLELEHAGDAGPAGTR